MTTIVVKPDQRGLGRHRRPPRPTRRARFQAWIDQPLIANRVLTVVATAGSFIITGILGGLL